VKFGRGAGFALLIGDGGNSRRHQEVAMMFRLTIAAALVMAFPASSAWSQEASARRLLEAGQYQEAADAVAAQGESASPSEVYVAGQSFARLDRVEEARTQYRRLDNGDEQNPWVFVGRSAMAALDGDLGTALEAANQAVMLAPDSFHARYQLGLVQSLRNDFAASAATLERATELDGYDAYAHYYAGIAYNKIHRVDRMAVHFQAFTKLAPDAPERPQVEAILRTLRG
jgi:tetratricopeptide (TPR) repeat protein